MKLRSSFILFLAACVNGDEPRKPTTETLEIRKDWVLPIGVWYQIIKIEIIKICKTRDQPITEADPLQEDDIYYPAGMVEQMAAMGMDVSELHVAKFNEDGDRALTNKIHKWAHTLEDGNIGRIKNIFWKNVKRPS